MDKQQAFEVIQKLVFDKSGMRISEKKLYLVETRLSGMCRENACEDFVELVNKCGPVFSLSHTQQIVEAMTTNETWWFRDMDVYNGLTQVVFPELVKRKLANGEKEILLWSAACSTGQEVYSLKLEWERFRAKAQGIELRIVASDIDHKVLEQAKAGRYSQLEIGRGLPTMDLMMNFQQDGATWFVNDELKKGIEWRQANLMQLPPFTGNVDVTLCRNVLIYFDDEGKRQILGNIKRAMKPEGLLFIGGSESVFSLNTEYQRLTVNSVFGYGHEPAREMLESNAAV